MSTNYTITNRFQSLSNQIENTKMKIKCCDGPIILSNLKESISQHLAPGTKLQILATPKSKNVVQCNDFIVLQDNANDFDMPLYNETIKMLIEQEDSNTYLINNVEEQWGSLNEKEINLIDQPDQAGRQNGDGNPSGSQSQSGAAKNDASFY